MEESTEHPGVRESRRKAALARDIVERWTGPRQSILRFTEEYPFTSVALAIVGGIAAGMILRAAR